MGLANRLTKADVEMLRKRKHEELASREDMSDKQKAEAAAVIDAAAEEMEKKAAGDLVKVGDEVKDVDGFGLDDCLAFMKENRFIKIAWAGNGIGKYRFVKPLPDHLIYEHTIGEPLPDEGGDPDGDNLAPLTKRDVKAVAGTGVDDVLKYMAANTINKIVPTPVPNRFRLVFLDHKFSEDEKAKRKNIYEKTIGKK